MLEWQEGILAASHKKVSKRVNVRRIGDYKPPRREFFSGNLHGLDRIGKMLEDIKHGNAIIKTIRFTGEIRAGNI